MQERDRAGGRARERRVAVVDQESHLPAVASSQPVSTAKESHVRGEPGEWAAPVGRVDVWAYLVGTGRWQLKAPVRVNTPACHLRLR